MTAIAKSLAHSPETAVTDPALMPVWVSPTRGKTLEDMAFFSGAALSHLHGVSARGPRDLLRARLALRAAEACMAHAGRPERAGELRDAVHFLRPGDLPGPAGEITLSWRRAVERPPSVKALVRALPSVSPENIAAWLDAGSATGNTSPVARAAATLEAVLTDMPRGEVPALILADAALAQALRWTHIVPLLALHLSARDLRKRGEDLRLACHRALAMGAKDAVDLSADLSRHVVALQMVAPKLRAKRSEDVVQLFLTRDAMAPADLTHLMSDRAARRICDRLVDLGGVRELTGRDTFRLYGV